LAENYVVQFHPSNFLPEVNWKKKSPIQDFFYRRELEFSVTMKSRKSRELIGEIIQTNFEFFYA
jgi:hypothetical protein